MSTDDLTSALLASKPPTRQRVPLTIHVYDLIPPGHLSNFLWKIGAGLVHSGIVLNEKEWAFGFHQKPGVTGVYHTEPFTEPPGATYRGEILHGFTYRDPDEIQDVIEEASQRFQGMSWDLLRNNCNHFTSFICEQLTGTPAPSYLNRAASIGVALPCFVPEQWVDAPEAEIVDPTFIEDELDCQDEAGAMLKPDTHDDEPDYDLYEMSDPNETDDTLREKWRRKRRNYRKPSTHNSHSVLDGSGNLDPHHLHFKFLHINHRGRRIRYRIKHRGHRLHVALQAHHIRHREELGSEYHKPHILVSIKEEREDAHVQMLNLGSRTKRIK